MSNKKTDDDGNESKELTLPLIAILIAMLVFGAASSKGMYQYGCQTNANASMYFLFNLVNSLLFGIPGLISAIHFKDTKFFPLKT